MGAVPQAIQHVGEMAVTAAPVQYRRTRRHEALQQTVQRPVLARAHQRLKQVEPELRLATLQSDELVDDRISVHSRTSPRAREQKVRHQFAFVVRRRQTPRRLGKLGCRTALGQPLGLRDAPAVSG